MLDLRRAPLDQRRTGPTNRQARSTNDHLPPTTPAGMTGTMAIAIVFLCGIFNFAAHRAVISSGHPLVQQMHRATVLLRPPVTLAVEFGALLVALLVVAQGSTTWAWAYVLYTLASGWSAWMLLTGRM